MKQSSKELLELVKKSLDDLKAKDITSMDVAKLASFTDYMVVATGNSKTHVRSLAENLKQELKVKDITVTTQSDSEGEWSLVDLGDVVVHIMQEEIRQFYSLEKLWDTFEESKAI